MQTRRHNQDRALRRGRSGARVFWLVALLFALLSSEANAENSLVCTPKAGEAIGCRIGIGSFLDDIRGVLNNGWENSLHFSLYLYDEDDEVRGITYTEVSQRCYIDPFDDPCLALWSGAESWETYLDVEAMIAGISEFQLSSVALDALPPGDYRVELTVELNPITDEQVGLIRSWLARHRGGHLVVGKNESSIFGAFVSVFANIRAGDAEATATIESESFAAE